MEYPRIEILKSIPVDPQTLEFLAEIANSLNEVLVMETRLYVELIHSRNEVYLLLIRVAPKTLPLPADRLNESID